MIAALSRARTRVKNGWALFRRAVAGDSNIDYTEGSIGRATFLLAVPMLLEMTMESIFAITDIFFVARLGTEAVATVGLTEAVITLLFAVAIGLSMGATALVARRIGEKDTEGAAKSAAQVLWLGLMVSVVVGALGIMYPREILALMGAEQAVVDIGTGYTRIMFGGSFTIMFLFLINAVFRGAGDANIAMRALVVANSINIVLDPCLIFGIGPFPEMGVTGAAVATNIGRSVGVLYGLYYLFGSGGRLRLYARHLALKLSVLLSLVRISAGGIGQFLVATASWVFLMQIVADFGSEPVAGYTLAVRIAMFTLLPAWGLSNAAAALVGQNLGAKQLLRAETATWQVARYTAIYSAVVAVLVVLFAPTMAEFFLAEDPVAIGYTVDTLRIFAYGYVFWGFGMTIIQAFNGAGDTVTPTLINFLCFWVFQVPFAYVLAVVLEMGPRGVFWAVFAADSLVGIIAVLFFMQGKWKKKQV